MISPLAAAQSSLSPHWTGSITTPLGTIAWLLSPRGVRRVELGPAGGLDRPPRLWPEAARRTAEGTAAPYEEAADRPVDGGPADGLSGALAERLSRLAAGEVVDFSDIPCDLTGLPEFTQQILTTCRGLLWGQTCSYGQLAARAGVPRAARAVGAALGRNPIPLIIPCHRVVGSTGRLIGFSAPGGTATKARLLALEGHSY